MTEYIFKHVSPRNLRLKLSVIFLLFIYLISSSVIPAFATISYSYDADGNMLSDGTYCYTYNEANQLSTVTNCGNGKTIAQYVYDYQGNRIVKKNYDTNGNLQQTTYTPTKFYETKKLANNTTQNTTYYYANDQLVARKNPDNSKTYYLPDNLGSTSVLADQNGAVVENTNYYPFGEIRSGGTQSKQLYTGQINDPETGLDYYNARYYNSHIRQFTQPDDVIADVYNPQDLNRYSYVNNNPLTNIDPTGHDPITDSLLEVLPPEVASYMAQFEGPSIDEVQQAGESIVDAFKDPTPDNNAVASTAFTKLFGSLFGEYASGVLEVAYFNAQLNADINQELGGNPMEQMAIEPMRFMQSTVSSISNAQRPSAIFPSINQIKSMNETLTATHPQQNSWEKKVIQQTGPANLSQTIGNALTSKEGKVNQSKQMTTNSERLLGIDFLTF